MKVAVVTVLPLLVASATVPAQRRDPRLAYGLEKREDVWDSIGGMLSTHLPGVIQWGASSLAWLMNWAESPVKFKALAPEIDQRATKTTLTYGPFYLKGTKETQGKEKIKIQMDSKSTVFLRTLKGLPWNAAILSAKTTLSYEDGSSADFSNGVYVHHILIADVSKPSAPFALCPNMHKEDNLEDWAVGYIMETLGAGLVQTGNDALGGANIYLPQKGNLKSAFLTNKDDTFGMQAEIVNYNPENRTVFLNLELEYLEEKPKGWLDASTIVLSATGCKDPGYRPPAGQKQYNHTSKPFAITQNGYIVNARGHLHDGGTAIELWLNEKMVCQSLPTYADTPGAAPGTPKTIVGMSWCHESVPIKKGDTVTVKTYYDVEKHPLRKEAGNEAKEGGAKEGGAKEGGHSHGGHGGEGGMEGMEEMGIMTTNFAWEAKEKVEKAKDKATPTAAAAPATSSGGSLWSSIFGGSSNTTKAESPKKTETEKVPNKALPSPSATPTQSWGEWLSGMFGYGTPSPAATGAPKAPAAPAAPKAPAAPAAPAAPKAPAAPAAPAAPKAPAAPASGMTGHSHS